MGLGDLTLMPVSARRTPGIFFLLTRACVNTPSTITRAVFEYPAPNGAISSSDCPAGFPHLTTGRAFVCAERDAIPHLSRLERRATGASLLAKRRATLPRRAQRRPL